MAMINQKMQLHFLANAIPW